MLWLNVLVHNTTNFRFKISDSSNYRTIIKLHMTTREANVTLHLESNITNITASYVTQYISL